MQYFKFENGVKIPMVGLGTYPLKGDVLSATIKDAINLGYELFDTATGYYNEQEIGDLVKEGILLPDNVFITSKIHSSILIGRKRYLYLNRKSIKKAYLESCKRLHIQKLGAYLLHMPFDGCSKHYCDLMRLYDEGRVCVIGVSNFDIRELKELYKKCGRWPMMNQTEISPYNTQKELIKFCQDNGILVQAYSPFGRGNLVNELMNNKTLVTIAEAHGKSIGQIILRFITQQGVAVVARSTNHNRLKDNLNIFDFVLNEEEMLSIHTLNSNTVFGVNQINKYNKKEIAV
jgi:diketogulonate reductase-like aldo/keto reductase